MYRPLALIPCLLRVVYPRPWIPFPGLRMSHRMDTAFPAKLAEQPLHLWRRERGEHLPQLAQRASRLAAFFDVLDQFSRLDTQPAPSPVNACPAASRPPSHDSGPVWFATPSLYETLTRYTLPAYPGASPLNCPHLLSAITVDRAPMLAYNA